MAIDAFVRVLGGDREYVIRTRDLSQGGLFLYTRVGHLYPIMEIDDGNRARLDELLKRAASGEDPY